MKKKVPVPAVCFLVAVIAAVGGVLWGLSTPDPGPEANIEQFVLRVLNAPDLGFRSAYDEMFSAMSVENFDPQTFDTGSYEASIRQAIADLLDGQTTEEMVELTLWGGAISSLHFEAARDGYSVVPQDVYLSLGSEEDQIYIFTVKVEVSAEDFPAFTTTLPGRLQLDEDGLIRYVDVRYGAVTRGVIDARRSA